ncbi:MAG TPA: hypothetical protein VF184_12125 [Phycisphaeraceae bacterium]
MGIAVLLLLIAVLTRAWQDPWALPLPRSIRLSLLERSMEQAGLPPLPSHAAELRFEVIQSFNAQNFWVAFRAPEEEVERFVSSVQLVRRQEIDASQPLSSLGKDNMLVPPWFAGHRITRGWVCHVVTPRRKHAWVFQDDQSGTVYLFWYLSLTQ